MSNNKRIVQLEQQVADLKRTGAAAIGELSTATEFCEAGWKDWPEAHERIDEWVVVVARVKREAGIWQKKEEN